MTRNGPILSAKDSLTAHEYELLYLFLQTPEKVYSRERLYELVWREGYYGENSVWHWFKLKQQLQMELPP